MSVATSLMEDQSARITPAPTETLYQFNESPLLARQSQQESNARSYPRRIPLALKRAKGIYVEDVEGRRFIDCLAGAGTLALGHNHPVVIEAIQQVLTDELPLHTLDLTTPVKDQFVQDLFGLLPPALAAEAKIQFCGPTGTDAVEAALKLVRTATGRSTVLSFQGGYHGMSQGALSLMGSLGPKKPLGALLSSGVQFMPYPYDYRCPFGLGGAQGVQVNLNYLENLLNDPEAGVQLPAAVIVEVVQGEGGVIPADLDWLRGLRRITEKAGVALIVDEIQSGFARTGKMFAFEHAGIIPDVVVHVQSHRRQPAAGGGGLSRLARHLAAGRPCRDLPRQSDGHGRRFCGDALPDRTQGLRARRRHGRTLERTPAHPAAGLPATG